MSVADSIIANGTVENAMAQKRILFRDAARSKLLAGATALADAVRVTLGPKSKCVLIGQSWGTPLVCNDGVMLLNFVIGSVARAIIQRANCPVLVARQYHDELPATHVREVEQPSGS
jgi:hypothetical protein